MIRHYMITQDDCLRTCVASLLECETVGEVPHFHAVHDTPDDEVIGKLNAYLKEYGLRHFGFAYAGHFPLEDVLKNVGANNPNVNYMVFGATFDDTPHVAIYRNAELHHNPAPWGAEIVKPYLGTWSIVTFIPDVLCYE